MSQVEGTTKTVINPAIPIATERSFSDTLYIKLLGRALIKYSTYSITEKEIIAAGGIERCYYWNGLNGKRGMPETGRVDKGSGLCRLITSAHTR